MAQEELWYGRTCVKEECVLREDMSYKKTCPTVKHVFWE